MKLWTLALGGLLWALGACGHAAPQVRACADCNGGVNSMTARLPVLLARGEFAQAELLIVELLKLGLLSQVQAEHYRQQARQLQEQRPDPTRPPPPVSPSVPWDEEPPDEGPTCGGVYPSHPLCSVLPMDYTFSSPSAALQALKHHLGEKSLALHARASTESGPCPGIGKHFNVRLGAKRVGSITCCKCCVDTTKGPIEWEKCRIVW